MALDVTQLRRQFPILHTQAHGRALVYLDNAATTQKPQVVIDAINRYYQSQNANIHRGVYHLSQLATRLYEGARQSVRRFLNAGHDAEIMFTRGTTEAINLVATSLSGLLLSQGDEVVVSHLEHHSNIVPWQMACQRHGATLRVIPINDAGELDLDAYARLLSRRTKIVAVNHVSNSLGTINDVAQIVRLAHDAGAKVLIDGAQWVAHGPTDVRAIDADFYTFSGHKLYGPTGIGALYGRLELLEAMPPYQGGGDMIESVSFGQTTYAKPPSRFEAGTPDIAGAVGLAAAIEFVESVGFPDIADHEHLVEAHLSRRLTDIPGLRVVGTAARKVGVASFVIENPPLASLDIGQQLDLRGIAVRTGHHCCQPVMDRFGIASTTRASLAMYNTVEEVDALVDALQDIITTARTRHAAASSNGAAALAGNTSTNSAPLRFPKPAADSPSAAAEALVDDMALLDDWKDRYEYLIEMGNKLPPMPAELKTPQTRVHGCQSTVHLYATAHPQQADVLQFLADSDADVVRGLIAVLQRLFSGQRARDVLAMDVNALFTRLGLDQHLSMGRRNGLDGMVRRIRQHAAQLDAANHAVAGVRS